MMTVAYLANRFPSVVEPYVMEEIEELRRRGVRVVAGSVRRPRTDKALSSKYVPELVLQRLSAVILLRAVWLCVRQWRQISSLIARVVFHGREGPLQRCKALAHTGLGACYAILLEGRGVDHIHVHHGYFGSWIAIVAARLLGVGFSMTLHGSDLLLHEVYLDAKLEACAFCLTVSEFNRRYILERYPRMDAAKVVVARLGVEVSERVARPVSGSRIGSAPFTLLAVGRLHAVKDHAFLVRACGQLRGSNVSFECLIAGAGPERRNLEALIRRCGLEERVRLLGHVPRERMDSFYDRADLVVLTSRSEGIPLVLMEAMARGKIVLAPAITGIPELVIAGRTGFLYAPGSLESFVDRLLFIRSLMAAPGPSASEPSAAGVSEARELEWIRHAAWVQVRNNFNRSKNLEFFGDLFMQRIAPQTESLPDENFVLQQI
ncbi:MAG TPA: glycosyltransferase family 4 protein [Candidatus Sulfotelmatobacter sp.]|nr:glycosyltransferase family 4 protein [Candidatus Sulfotelmatobacter sp.]